MGKENAIITQKRLTGNAAKKKKETRSIMKKHIMLKKAFFSFLLFLGVSFTFGACGKESKEDNEITKDTANDEDGKDTEEEMETVEDLSDYIEKDSYRNQTSVHDVSLFKDGNLYYAFGSHMSAATSSDLWNWDFVANGVSEENKLFTGLFESDAFAWCGTNEDGSYSMWAPDVIYNSKMGKYCMYFGVLGEDDKASICLATSDNISGPFTFAARVLDSGFDQDTVSETLAGTMFGADAAGRNYFDEDGNWNAKACPTAQDPCVFYDADGALWMVYGSWDGGIYMLELNKKTGLPVSAEDNEETGTDAYFGTHILGYGNQSCEAPYIMYSDETGYYYLFVSYGNASSDGGYDIREFRSESVTGPYVDAMGQTWTEGTEGHESFGVKIMGNYRLPGNEDGYVSGGHPAVITDSDGKFLLVYHTRFEDGGEDYELRVHQMFLNEEGWLTADPFNMNNLTKKETLKESGYGTKKLYGTYYVINQETEISADVTTAETIRLSKENVVDGTSGGYWEKIEDTPYANLTINDQTYQGVFIRQKDEGGHKVMVFTGICDENNQTIWAVKYLELGKKGDKVPETVEEDETGVEAVTDGAVVEDETEAVKKKKKNK
jgi:arabinan endo-1,5-alpha-L-arabinosidase